MTRWASQITLNRANDSSKSRGFTIVELLIVVVVIAILAAIAIVAYNGITGRARVTALQSSVQQAGKKVTVHAVLNSEALPATLAEAGVTNSADTTYQYTRNTASTPNNFCITATSGDTSAHIAGTPGSVFKPVEGPCAGHTGTAPTVAASGEPCPSGFIVVPGSSLYGTDAFCVMKYEAKIQGQANGNQTYSSGLVAESRTSGTPWVNISQTNAIAEANALGSGYHLISEAEWLTIAQNVMSVASNWSGGSVGSGAIYAGHNDNVPAAPLSAAVNDANGCYSTVTAYEPANCSDSGAQRRTLTLTNGEVIWDFAGNVWEWTNGAAEGTGSQPGSTSGYVWRQWNQLTPASAGASVPSLLPSYATDEAAYWDSSKGIGQVHSNPANTDLRAFRRGGTWTTGAQSGIFAMAMNFAPGNTSADTGFRVAR